MHHDIEALEARLCAAERRRPPSPAKAAGAVLLLLVSLAPTSAGQSWELRDNSLCVGDRDPGDYCTGVGAGTGDNRWHLDLGYSNIKWGDIVTALVLTNRVLVCGSVRMPTVDNAATAAELKRACPTSEDGNIFPVRRKQASDVSFTFADLAKVGAGAYDVTPECSAEDMTDSGVVLGCCTGDGTSTGANQCAAGTGGADSHYDKWPGALWNNTPYNWRLAAPDWTGRWVAPWNGQAREIVRKHVKELMLSKQVLGQNKAALQDVNPTAGGEE